MLDVVFGSGAVICASKAFSVFRCGRLQVVGCTHDLTSVLVIKIDASRLISSCGTGPVVPFARHLRVVRTLGAPSVIVPRRALSRSRVIGGLGVSTFIIKSS